MIEALPEVIAGEDRDTVKELVRHLSRKQNVSIKTNCKLQEVKQDKDLRTLLEGGDALKVETVLVSIGREPVFEALNLPQAQVVSNSFIQVDQHYKPQAKVFLQ